MAAPHRRFRGAHFASFWKFFDDNDEALTVDGWRIKGGSRLADAIVDDLLWLFPSGVKCRSKLDEDEWPADIVETAAYLAEVFTVRRVVPEQVGDFELYVEGCRSGASRSPRRSRSTISCGRRVTSRMCRSVRFGKARGG